MRLFKNILFGFLLLSVSSSYAALPFPFPFIPNQGANNPLDFGILRFASNNTLIPVFNSGNFAQIYGPIAVFNDINGNQTFNSNIRAALVNTNFTGNILDSDLCFAPNIPSVLCRGSDEGGDDNVLCDGLSFDTTGINDYYLILTIQYAGDAVVSPTSHCQVNVAGSPLIVSSLSSPSSFTPSGTPITLGWPLVQNLAVRSFSADNKTVGFCWDDPDFAGSTPYLPELNIGNISYEVSTTSQAQPTKINDRFYLLNNIDDPATDTVSVSYKLNTDETLVSGKASVSVGSANSNNCVNEELPPVQHVRVKKLGLHGQVHVCWDNVDEARLPLTADPSTIKYEFHATSTPSIEDECSDTVRNNCLIVSNNESSNTGIAFVKGVKQSTRFAVSYTVEENNVLLNSPPIIVTQDNAGDCP